MENQFARAELIFKKQGMETLFNARVAVFGIGGVGGYVVEALARSGIGAIDLFDDDKICITNINRQIIATHKTVGKYKVDVAKERILDINPKATVNTYKLFYMPDTADQVDLSVYDYVVDAIDTVTGKIELVIRCKEAEIPIISSMGAGNKINADLLEVADIYKTSVCPLAKVMRRELKARGIKNLKVVYSKEMPRELDNDTKISSELERMCLKAEKRQIPGSTAFVPPAAGLIIAGEVIKDLIGIK
ncbi:MAG: tRNA threonylcarbamoyladenosine dehydratase [Eubacteriaceae bacterium]